MASLQELATALINADRAGDSTAAKILAREVDVARRRQSLNVPGVQSEAPGVGFTEPGPMARVGRGFMDVADSAQKLALDVTDPSRAAQFQRDRDSEISRYERDRGPGAGFDLLRTAGTAAATLPLVGGTAYLAPAAATASTVGRVALGAVQGAEQGALTWTPEGQSKGVHVVMGAATGGLAPFLSDAVSHVVARATQFGKAQAAKLAANPERIVAELEPVLEKQGIRWADLSEEVRRGMVMQARRQMSIDGDMNPEVVARKAEMDEVLGAAGPTRGQVLRDPKEWSWERNTSKLPRIAAPGEEDLTDRFRAQLTRLQDAAREITKRTGATAQNEYQAGASTTSAITSKFESSKAQVDKLYEAFRSSGAGGVEVKPQGIADALGKVAEEYGVEHIPAPVASRLKDFGLMEGKQSKLLTVDEAEKLRKLISNNMDPKTPAQMKTLMILKDSVDEAVMGTEGANTDLLKTARGAAASRFGERDASRGVTAAVEGMEPDHFFRKFVVNGTVKDLQGLKATLTTGVNGGGAVGAQAWSDIKGQTLERAVEKATSQGDIAFSGKAFRKALDEIGDERLKVIFEPTELAQIRKLDRVAYDATVEPALSAVNHSNTAAAGAQYLRDAGRAAAPRLAEAATGIPFVGKVAAGMWQAGDDVARNAELRRRVSRALTGDLSNATEKRRVLAELISGRIDPYATAGAAAGGSYFSR